MSRLAVSGHKPRAPPQWRVILTRVVILTRAREHRLTEVEPEERPLEAMLHWRDPVERLRRLRCQRRSLLDDNPSSG